MRRRVIRRSHFVRHRHFAERLCDDAVYVCEAADYFQTNPYVAVSDAGFYCPRQIVPLRVPECVSARFSRKLDHRVRHDLKTKLPGGHRRRDSDIG